MGISIKHTCLVIAFLALSAGTAVAGVADVYIAQSAAGTADGSSCASAKASTFFNTASNWGSGAAQIGPGTKVHLCGTLTSTLIFQADGTSGNPITLLFESGAKMSKPTWGGSYAIHKASGNWLIVDGGTNGLIESTNNGSKPTYATANDDGGVYFPECNNCIIRNLTVANLFRKNTLDAQGGGDAIDIHKGSNNSIYNNTVHDSNIGILVGYGASSTQSGTRVYGNTIYNINWGIATGDSGAGAVFNDYQIYNNVIYDAYMWDDLATNQYHHNGIIVWITNSGSVVSNLKIYGNYIHGDFGDRETGHIFLDGEDSGGGYTGALIFNNLLIDDSATTGPSNGLIITKANGGSPAVGVYNNTMLFTTNVGSRCIMNQGARLSIKNNILSRCGTGLYLSAGTVQTSDYNIWYSNTNISAERTLADWVSATGFDTHSLTSDPRLDSEFKPVTGSPVLDAGINLSNLGVASLTQDKALVPRPASGAWSIGAYQGPAGSAAPPPNPPTQVSVVVHTQ